MSEDRTRDVLHGQCCAGSIHCRERCKLKKLVGSTLVVRAAL